MIVGHCWSALEDPLRKMTLAFSFSWHPSTTRQQYSCSRNMRLNKSLSRKFLPRRFKRSLSEDTLKTNDTPTASNSADMSVDDSGPRKTFFNLLAVDPSCKFSEFSNEQSIYDLLIRHPDVCSVQYNFEFEGILQPLYPLFILCAMRVSLVVVEAAYQAYPDAIQERDVNGQTVLHAACEYGAPLRVLSFLVNAFPEAINMTDAWDQLPLHQACGKHSSMVSLQLLLQQNPDTIQATTNIGLTVLHIACMKNAPMEVMEFLLTRRPLAIAMPNKYGLLPLHYACASGASWHFVKILVERYPQAITVTQPNGWLPIHLACANKAPVDIVRLLLDFYPLAVQEKTNKGWTALHLACWKDAPTEVIRLLVDFYPDGVKETTKEGWTPLHFCCAEQGSVEVLQLLLAADPAGARKRTRGSSIWPLGGLTPEKVARKRNAPPEVFEILRNSLSSFKNMVDNTPRLVRDQSQTSRSLARSDSCESFEPGSIARERCSLSGYDYDGSDCELFLESDDSSEIV